MIRIIILSVFINTLPLFAESQCNHPDYAGLMDLYNSTGGPNWTNNIGWKEGAAGTNCDPCNGWYGVYCNNNNSRVQGIQLHNNNLVGDIPVSVNSLTKLLYLGLSKNQLNGVLPASIFNLENLKGLDVSFNSLSGSIPNEILKLQHVAELSLNNNLFSGSIPITIGNIAGSTDSVILDISNNLLTGEIPKEIGDIKSLHVLKLNNNNLTGSIPVEIINFPDIRVIELQTNLLNGCIPIQIKKYCKDTLFGSGWRRKFDISNNPLLPWKGEKSSFCSSVTILDQIGAPCDDLKSETIDDLIYPNCVCKGIKADTCLQTLFDTIIVLDTITEIITDTTYVIITETISVTDTLIINLNIPNGPNDPITNRIIVYPNPASSHIYIDFGNHTLIQNYSCQILNALGQPVFFTPIDQKLYYLDLNTWDGKGTYFIKMINDFGQTVETKKIILQ